MPANRLRQTSGCQMRAVARAVRWSSMAVLKSPYTGRRSCCLPRSSAVRSKTPSPGSTRSQTSGWLRVNASQRGPGSMLLIHDISPLAISHYFNCMQCRRSNSLPVIARISPRNSCHESPTSRCEKISMETHWKCRFSRIATRRIPGDCRYSRSPLRPRRASSQVSYNFVAEHPMPCQIP